MFSERWQQVLRLVILGGLLAYFCYALAHGIAREHAEATEFGRLPNGPGTDVGVRVLLKNRDSTMGAGKAPPQPSDTFDRVTIRALRPLSLRSPDDADGDHRPGIDLPAGEELTVGPDLNRGLSLSMHSHRGGSEVVWKVSRVLLVPRELSAGDRWRAPRKVEADGGAATFALGQNRYRGTLEFLYLGPKKIHLINHLPLEAYLEGVVAVEMAPYYPLEALKAQAIASRGYGLRLQRFEQIGRAHV